MCFEEHFEDAASTAAAIKKNKEAREKAEVLVRSTMIENTVDYIVRAEGIRRKLGQAGQKVMDKVFAAYLLKGLKKVKSIETEVKIMVASDLTLADVTRRLKMLDLYEAESGYREKLDPDMTALSATGQVRVRGSVTGVCGNAQSVGSLATSLATAQRNTRKVRRSRTRLKVGTWQTWRYVR